MRIVPFALLLALAACDGGTATNSAAAVDAPAPAERAQNAAAEVQTALATEPAGELVVGAAAPDFELPGSDGQTHRLSDYRGQHVVLAFFPKAFTGG